MTSMVIHALSPDGTVQRSYCAKWPYLEFFHGRAGGVANRYGEKPYRPLPLRRNKRLMPPVFFASISLVVREEIAQQLALFDSVDLNPCKWEKVYDYPADEQGVDELCRQFSIIDDSFTDWLEERYREPDAEVQKVRYFEVMVPRFETVRSAFQCSNPLDLPSPPYETLEPTTTDSKLHKLYPVLTYVQYYLMTSRAFRIMEPHVKDPELFGVYEVDLENTGA
jgi:hypothetical protein